ncbi:RraA family protein [Alkalicoccobacillus murimartini]|uniref:Putative 4-hydroxy-4-methyl-2-oxoglutarate aldolase n=1 Tax=Alkalicoccobacillus murimartini TaxID=171685 RepID=A0ABT9YGE6_9BACI|nr:RraA family protein [Alkalicoccobacillus murimartini]MDQ0206900.1 regulator of RNase E activity RraA [Alkalicoccobacillus murimartini]
MNENIKSHPLPELLPQEWVKRAEALSTTLLSDILEHAPEMDYKIKPAVLTHRMIGSALTVETAQGDNLAVHYAMHQAKKGYVLVVNAHGYEQRAIIGELMMEASIVIGFEGFVIDGLVRDASALSRSSFPIFSRGYIPAGPTKDGPGTINSEISCGGQKVRPGDFIMGDADGVIVIPRDQVEDALTRAEKKELYEQDRIDEIKKGRTRPKWLK